MVINAQSLKKNVPKPENSPLHNLYPFMYPMGFQPPFASNFPQPQGYGYRNPRPRSYTKLLPTWSSMSIL
jgi:hypothetical protein